MKEGTSSDDVATSGDTIFWNPDMEEISSTSIEYSYVVKLNELAGMDQGIYDEVPLNKPTYFKYSTTVNGVTTNKEELFPIPEAIYELSSVQVKWQYQGTDILPSTDVEKVISDYEGPDYDPETSGLTYTPTFETDLEHQHNKILIPNSDSFYIYVGTTVTTGDGDSLPDISYVDASKTEAYTVIHHYALVNPGVLILVAEKVLDGRNFRTGDTFTLKLEPVTAGAPMPESDTVTITPRRGQHCGLRV